MLKLKLQYLDHLMQTAESLEKTWGLGKIRHKRRRSLQRMRGLIASTQWPWLWANCETVSEDRGAQCSAVHGVTMQLRRWTPTTKWGDQVMFFSCLSVWSRGSGVGVGGSTKREGAYVYSELISVVQQKPTQYCKTIILQLKKKAEIPPPFNHSFAWLNWFWF